MRISDWSSDVCSSDLRHRADLERCFLAGALGGRFGVVVATQDELGIFILGLRLMRLQRAEIDARARAGTDQRDRGDPDQQQLLELALFLGGAFDIVLRSEEHTSELQSLMRISYAVFCL